MRILEIITWSLRLRWKWYGMLTLFWMNIVNLYHKSPKKRVVEKNPTTTTPKKPQINECIGIPLSFFAWKSTVVYFIYKPCRDCGDFNHYEVLPQMVTSNASLGSNFSLVQPLSNHVVNITKKSITLRTCLSMKSILFQNISLINALNINNIFW